MKSVKFFEKFSLGKIGKDDLKFKAKLGFQKVGIIWDYLDYDNPESRRFSL